MTYEQSEKHRKDYLSSLKLQFQEGKTEGLVEGEQKGRAEGLAEGELKGKLETARNLLQQGISIEVVRTATGLSEEQLESLSVLSRTT